MGAVGGHRADSAGASRLLWTAVEPIHAVTYFAPACRDALRRIGLRGFWMGYFGARAAPMGTVEAATVTATFFNFHPVMVERSIPDAWSFADRSSILTARATGAAAALRGIAPPVDRLAEAVVPDLQQVVEGADGSGRALFGANRALVRSEDPVEALWQACTSLREHRGDGHVAALTAAGLSGCQALVLFAASEGIPATLFLDSSGWSADEWEQARAALEARGLLHGPDLSPAGSELRREIERQTDQLAGSAFSTLGLDGSAELVDRLRPLADLIVGAGVIPFPNPIGLPARAGGPGGPDRG
jgi:hypothetical protein